MSDLGILGLEFKATIVIFEISNLEFVENEYLTYAVNFDTGSAFSKGPRSAPSESPGQLCKVYPIQ